MPYELKREDIYDFARFINAETTEKGDELEFKLCPKCKGGNHNDKDTFSINLTSGAFSCQRASCDYHGHFVELCRDFDFPLEFDTPKIYKQLKQPTAPIQSKPKAVEYLESRGISRAVTERYEITTRNDNPNVLVFPFYNEYGKLMFIKYRNTNFVKGKTKGSKEWSENDTQPILFGMKQCTDFDKLIITEGQIDSLSVAECGFNNAVSVPTGANGFTWIGPCWDWITQFTEIIVFGDNENGKMTLLDTLYNRLAVTDVKVKAVRLKDYLGEKDANDILRRYGPEAVRKAIEGATVPVISNVKDIATEVRFRNIDNSNRIETGIESLDRVIGGLAPGEVTLLTGNRGEGKSTFMSQLICSALEQKQTVFVYSGEMQDYYFKFWLYLQLAGAKNIDTFQNKYGDDEYSISKDVQEKISDWIKGRAFIYDNDVMPTNDGFDNLLETIEKVIRQYGVTCIFVDNLMTAMSRVERQSDLYLAQSNFVGDLKEIAKRFSVSIVLVAHPRKSIGKNSRFDNDDVSGASEITNKVDNVLNYSRAKGDSVYDCKVEVTKNRFSGKLRCGDKAIKLKYSEKSKRIFDYDIPSIYSYGWETNTASNEWERVDDLPF